MNKYDITFIYFDEVHNVKFSHDDVIQVTFREGSVNLITSEKDGSIYSSNIRPQEYNKIIIERR